MSKKEEIKSCATCKFVNTKEFSYVGEEETYTEYKCSLQNNRTIYDSTESEKECELGLYESE